MALLTEAIEAGMAPDDVADLVHDAIVGDRFWIFTDLGMVAVLEERFRSILENRNPAPVTLTGRGAERHFIR